MITGYMKGHSIKIKSVIYTMAIVYIINIMPIGLAAEIYVPGTSYEGVTFIANDTGTYRFTMTGGG